MNVLMIYEELNLLTDKDKQKIILILKKNNLLMPYHKTKNVVQHCLSLALLIYFFWSEKGVVNPLVGNLRYDESGAPRLSISYSSSYCLKAVCCIMAETEVGVDIQDFYDIKINDIEEYASEYEIENLQKIETWKLHAIRLFSLKECLGKYYNMGLNYPLKKFYLLDLEDTFVKYGLKFNSVYFDEYIISFCSPQNLFFRIQKVSYRELMYMVEILLNNDISS